MNEFELREKIKKLEKQLEQYKLEEVGIYTPKHILNTKSEFRKAIRENLKEQRYILMLKIYLM